MCLCIHSLSCYVYSTTKTGKWDTSRSLRYNQDSQREEGLPFCFLSEIQSKYRKTSNEHRRRLLARASESRRLIETLHLLLIFPPGLC